MRKSERNFLVLMSILFIIGFVLLIMSRAFYAVPSLLLPGMFLIALSVLLTFFRALSSE